MESNKNIQYQFPHQRGMRKLGLQLIYLIIEFSESKTLEKPKSCLIASFENNLEKSKKRLLFHIKILGKSEEFKTEESDKYIKVIHDNGNYFVINKN